MSLFQDRAGTLWIGTALGLYRLHEGAGAPPFTTPFDVESSEVTALAEDRTGALWAGTSNGLYRRLANGQVEHYTVSEGLPASDVNALLAEGRVSWLGDPPAPSQPERQDRDLDRAVARVRALFGAADAPTRR